MLAVADGADAPRGSRWESRRGVEVGALADEARVAFVPLDVGAGRFVFRGPLIDTTLRFDDPPPGSGGQVGLAVPTEALAWAVFVEDRADAFLPSHAPAFIRVEPGAGVGLDLPFGTGTAPRRHSVVVQAGLATRLDWLEGGDSGPSALEPVRRGAVRVRVKVIDLPDPRSQPLESRRIDRGGRPRPGGSHIPE